MKQSTIHINISWRSRILCMHQYEFRNVMRI